jgi:hypothetical protein
MRASRSHPLRRALSRRHFVGTTTGRDTSLEVHGVLRARDRRVPTWAEAAA